MSSSTSCIIRQSIIRFNFVLCSENILKTFYSKFNYRRSAGTARSILLTQTCCPLLRFSQIQSEDPQEMVYPNVTDALVISEISFIKLLRLKPSSNYSIERAFQQYILQKSNQEKIFSLFRAASAERNNKRGKETASSGDRKKRFHCSDIYCCQQRCQKGAAAMKDEIPTYYLYCIFGSCAKPRSDDNCCCDTVCLKERMYYAFCQVIQ